ncbi:DNA polymerase III subunit gamma and tau [Nocardia sp. NPDC052566]|uniref:DNA polymerase III subunit gamma and tau n=1 Tax=Nocardia sp. NPDC052566 TaxID=3364330 RepID=UPI0037C7FD8C
MALYRKYRPATFAEVVGQEHVTDPLSTALDTGRISHAYLFSGPRGCGKTSSARILARSLNCVQGPTSKPCGVCPSCVALGPGGPGNLDVIELDAASHGGVDDTRELRDRAFYAPAESRYRVFIVDEAHMVTTAGFNALLKIVEEPPAHLIFIFATTEPDKVLPTIRSRTHHYPFRLLPPATMRGLLGKICEQEQVPVEEAVYPLVIRAGGGSPRDSLSVLDQLLAGAGPEGVTYPRAVSLLGVTDVALIDDAIDALAIDDGAALFGTVDRVMEAGHDPRRFAVDLLERLRDLILMRAVPDAVERGLVSGPGDVLDRMRDQADRIGAATLARYAELLHDGLGEMRGATAPRLLLEVVCARMLLPSVSDAESATLQRLERLERGIATGVVAAASAASAQAPAESAQARPAAADPSRRRGAEALAALRESRAGRDSGAGGQTQAGVPGQTRSPGQDAAHPGAPATSAPTAAGQSAAASAISTTGAESSTGPAGQIDSSAGAQGSVSAAAQHPGGAGQGSPVAAAAAQGATEAAGVHGSVSAASSAPAQSPAGSVQQSAAAPVTTAATTQGPAGIGEPIGVTAVPNEAGAAETTGGQGSAGTAEQGAAWATSAAQSEGGAAYSGHSAGVEGLAGATAGVASSAGAAERSATPTTGGTGSAAPMAGAQGGTGAAGTAAGGQGSAGIAEQSAAWATSAAQSSTSTVTQHPTGATASAALIGDDKGATADVASAAGPAEQGAATAAEVGSTDYSAGQVEQAGQSRETSGSAMAATSATVGPGSPTAAAQFAPDAEQGLAGQSGQQRETSGSATATSAAATSAASQFVTSEGAAAGGGQEAAGSGAVRAAESAGATGLGGVDAARGGVPASGGAADPAGAHAGSAAAEFGAAQSVSVPSRVAAPVNQESQSAEPTAGAGEDLLAAVEAAWPDIRTKVREFGATLQALLSGASVARVDGNTIVFAHQSPPLVQRLSSPQNVDAVRSAVRAVLGGAHEVRWEAGGAPARPAAAPRPAGAGTRARAAGREPGAKNTDGGGPPRFSRPSQAKGAAADKSGGTKPRGAEPRSFGGDDDIPPPDFPDLPDDPGPADFGPVDTGATDQNFTPGYGPDGVPAASTPEEEQEMLAEAEKPVAAADRRDPDEMALELLKSELGATRLDG